MAKMREIPVNDFYAKNGTVREDGRIVHDMYFVQVKTPARIDRPLGLLQDPGDDSGRSGVSPAGGRRLPAGQTALDLRAPRR